MEAKVKDVVSNLVQMLEATQKEAESLVDTMHRLQSYLEEKPKSIIQGSLDRLLGTIRAEAAKITGGNRRSVVVLVSPEGRVTVDETYGDENSDSYLMRLKSQGFWITRLDEFSSFIESLKSEVAGENWIRAIEFLGENAKFGTLLAYSPAPTLIRESERDKPSGWKPSDFLPAPPPHLPLPRGLFKH